MINWEYKAKLLGFSSEGEMLKSLYSKYSICEMSRIMVCSESTLRLRMMRYSIPFKSPGGPNNSTRTQARLHWMDQRFVEKAPAIVLARMIRVHRSMIFKYRGRKHGLLRDSSSRGLREVCEIKQASPGTGSDR